MEIPELVRERLGEEEIAAAVDLGGEDVVCFTPTRTLVYHSEGLLSDHSVEIYDHDVEQLDIAEGRRKTTFTLAYVDRTEKFSVPSKHGERVLEHLLDAILSTSGILDQDEELAGVYRFSELTLIITDNRLLKHIGASVWNTDYEEYHFSNVTGLSFEEGSVATQIVLSVGDRPHRIKAPNDEIPLLRQTLTETLTTYHDVESLTKLPEPRSQEESPVEQSAELSRSSTLSLDDSIAPLVGDSNDSADTDSSISDPSSTAPESSTGSDPLAPSTETPEKTEAHSESSTADSVAEEDNQSAKRTDSSTETPGSGQQPQTPDSGQQPPTTEASGIDPEEFETLKRQVSKLTTAVQRQNELLKQQHETIQRLLDSTDR